MRLFPLLVFTARIPGPSIYLISIETFRGFRTETAGANLRSLIKKTINTPMEAGGSMDNKNSNPAFFHWSMERSTVPVIANNQVSATRHRPIVTNRAPVVPKVR